MFNLTKLDLNLYYKYMLSLKKGLQMESYVML